MPDTVESAPSRWLVLLYQFPKGPDARRVRVWRRLQRIGAVAVKNSVYVLPPGEQSREDLAWLLAELRGQGAEAALIEAQFVDGLSDQDVRSLFNEARTADYRHLAEETDAAIAALPAGEGHAAAEAREAARRTLARARKRLAEIEEIDFFSAPGQAAAATAIRALAGRISSTKGETDVKATNPATAVQDLVGRVWVTRRGVRVDRIASAWLIRRWLDPDARFKFVAATGYQPERGEVRFDMFDAEFTHEGDRCTFEVLAGLARPDDPALCRIGEIVHDIDLKDAKFGRAETEGIATLLSGLVAATEDDERRLERGRALFDDLYQSFLAK